MHSAVIFTKSIFILNLEYENLTRDYEKSKAVIAKEGIPNFFIKCLGDLEEYIQKVSISFKPASNFT